MSQLSCENVKVSYRVPSGVKNQVSHTCFFFPVRILTLGSWFSLDFSTELREVVNASGNENQESRYPQKALGYNVCSWIMTLDFTRKMRE